MLILLIQVILLGFGILSAAHALLNKRDPRSALGWIAVCLLLPGAGALLYWLAGVNRVRNRAQSWQTSDDGMTRLSPRLCPWPQGASDAEQPDWFDSYRPLIALSDAITRRPLVPGNRLALLENGEEAYPEMLTAIGQARESVYLSSYIFETNRTGCEFVAALKAAADRGVDVRVLVDALGERYSWPLVHRLLRGSRVKVARFLPFSLSGRGIYFNLRNHRKLLVIDDQSGFTGGMNIGDRHLARQTDNPRRVRDLHFRIAGPVATHLHEAFLEDWGFATGDESRPVPLPELTTSEGAFCRGISIGPNEETDKLTWLIVGALNSAHRSVRIMTPYFIPDRVLTAAFKTAALRGVDIDLILPQRSNLPFVDWASRPYLADLLQHNIHLHLQPGPFNHTKMLLIDDCYAMVGSANIDSRSLRLNFEFNLEVYDRPFNAALSEHFNANLETSTRLTSEELQRDSLATRIRNSVCKLFSPYL